jgi:hypothetical protein
MEDVVRKGLHGDAEGGHGLVAPGLERAGELGAESGGVGCATELGGDGIRAAVVHLARVEHGLADERRDRIRATVPEEAAVGLRFDPALVVLAEEPKARDVGEVEERRRAAAGEDSGAAAGGNPGVRSVVTSERPRRVVAARAARTGRLGQRAIEEDRLPEGGLGRGQGEGYGTVAPRRAGRDDESEEHGQRGERRRAPAAHCGASATPRKASFVAAEAMVVGVAVSVPS